MACNTKNEMWLPVSLFSAKLQWSELIRAAIKPYLQNLLQSKKLLHYRFQIDHEGGENIRLAMLVKSDIAEGIAKASDDYFKTYFINKKRKTVDRSQPAIELFMRLPSNIICYGLYQIDEVSSGVPTDDAFRTEFSDLLIEGLSAGETNNLNILTLAFQLYLSLLITIWKIVEVRLEELMSTQFQFTSLENVMIDLDLVKKRFEEQKWDMFDFTYGIMKQSENQPLFMQRWEELCKNRITAVKDAGIEDVRSIFNQISFFIDRQLDISESMKCAIYYFVKRVTTI